MRLARKLRSLVLINAVVALWIAITGNVTFFGKIVSLTPFDGWRAITFYLSAFIVLWAYINLLLQLLTWGRLAKPVLTVILLACSLTAFFIDAYGVGINAGQIQNMMETDIREVLDLVGWSMLAYVIVVAGVPIAWIWYRPVQEEKIWSRMLSRLTASAISLVLILSVAAIFYADYASIFRNNRELRDFINPHNYVAGLRKYVRQMTPTKNLPFLSYGEDAKVVSVPSDDKRPRLMVLVVGETARSESFGLNGAVRNTTPELEKRDVVSFTNVSACGTSTAVSLPCMFSGFQREEYDQGIAARRENLLDILKRANYQVSWMDNNSGCKGVCDRVESVPVLESRRQEWCKDGNCFDDILADSLKDYLSKADPKDRVIVLHNLGSHGPAYYKRYPMAFRKFTPTCDTNELQTCSPEQVRNTYENTILYTDYVLSRIVDIVKAQEGRYRPAFLYVSDHGESTGENGLYLHGAPYLFAPSQQTHIPMVAWLSPSFVSDKKVSCFVGRKSASLSHDNLFHTVLGLLNVSTRVYRSDLDMSSGC